MSSQAWTDYAPPAVPYFVYVDGDGTVGGEGSAASWDRVADLLRRARNDTRLYSGATSSRSPAPAREPGDRRHPRRRGDRDRRRGAVGVVAMR